VFIGSVHTVHGACVLTAAVGSVLTAAVGSVLTAAEGSVLTAAVGSVLTAAVPNTSKCFFTLHIYLEENISNVHYEEK
jgi:hypothetical protein